jgi:hypothetical protein
MLPLSRQRREWLQQPVRARRQQPGHGFTDAATGAGDERDAP